MKLNTRVDAEALSEGFDVVVLATGVTPRATGPSWHRSSLRAGYLDVLKNDAPVGKRVALIGAGGIGFDVAEFLTHQATDADAIDEYWRSGAWIAAWNGAGGLKPAAERAGREVTLCQRKAGKLGAGLGKTTGWIHRSALKKQQGDDVVPLHSPSASTTRDSTCGSTMSHRRSSPSTTW